MSAGTILCMAGNKIFMDYSSSLGPIDPQVVTDPNRTGNYQYVPALGYLDMVERLTLKSSNNTISPAEYAILQNLDLAMLRRYEQARDLSVDLLKKWLINYKFNNWTVHSSNQTLLGQPVRQREKEDRAENIAKLLGDNKIWHSHGRSIGIQTLQQDLRLKIEDYSSDIALTEKIRVYNTTLGEYFASKRLPFVLHSA